jgi:hypothetical protein
MRQRPAPAVPPEPGDDSTTNYRLEGPPSPRRGLYVALAMTIGVVFCAALAAGAYFIGKGQQTPDGGTAKSTQPTHPPVVANDVRAPNLDEPAYAPESAAQQVGKVCTVEYRVAAVAGGECVCLKSSPDDLAPGAFIARLDAGLVGQGNRDDVVKRFDGKVIRVRGQVHKPLSGPTTMEVESFRQLLVVPPR